MCVITIHLNFKSFYQLVSFNTAIWSKHVFLKIEYCAVTKFFVKESLTPNEINSKLIKIYRDSSFSTIKKWAVEFQCSHTSLEDDSCEWCPKSATMAEITEWIYDIVLHDHQVNVGEIAEALDISKEH